MSGANPPPGHEGAPKLAAKCSEKRGREAAAAAQQEAVLRSLVEQKIPFLQKVPMRVVDLAPGRARVRCPRDPSNDNYIGTLHAGAIFTLGETCAGLAVGTPFDLDRVRMVARRATIEYRKSVTAELTGEATVPPGTLVEAREALDRHGRAVLAVHVAIRDPAGEMAAEMTVEYHLRKTR